MLDTLFSLMAPHHCCGCGQIGTLLCENCKYDIISEPFSACVACGRDLATATGLCGKCITLPYARAWCVAPRREQLQRLIDNYKFTYVYAAFRPLADLLDAYLPELPHTAMIVPIPTVNSHIRQRGYDHTLLVARRLADLRNLPLETSLQRATNSMQRGANARQRTKQAKEAYRCNARLDADAIYVLVDDVITTGATVKYAAQTLIDAGAKTVWVVSISRQSLD